MTALELLAIAYVKARGTKNALAHYRKLEAYVNQKVLAPQRYEQEQPRQRRAA